MEKKLWVGLGAVSLGALVVYAMSGSSDALDAGSQAQLPAKTTQQSDSSNWLPVPPVKPAAALVEDEPIEEEPLVDITEAYSDEGFKAQFMMVADVYEETMKYPPNSVPLTAQALPQYIPNQYTPTSVRFETQYGETLNLGVSLDRYRYFSGDDIAVTAKVNGLGAGSSVTLRAEILDEKGKSVASQSLDEEDQSNVFLGLFSPSRSKSEKWGTDLHMNVSFTWRGEDYQVRTPFKLSPRIATVIDVEDARVNSEYLEIPLEVDVVEDGDYAASANLYSLRGKPLIHLEGEGRLSNFKTRIKLKAHIAALKAGGDEGPYMLKDIWLKKLPDRPGQKTAYGDSSQDDYPVEGFPFSDFADKEYVDPMAEERLKFLRKMGST